MILMDPAKRSKFEQVFEDRLEVKALGVGKPDTRLLDRISSLRQRGSSRPFGEQLASGLACVQ
jgi:hypothetical protein